MADSEIAIKPSEWIKMLIVGRGMSFDQAFSETSSRYLKQTGKVLPRGKMAKEVVSLLERELSNVK